MNKRVLSVLGILVMLLISLALSLLASADSPASKHNRHKHVGTEMQLSESAAITTTVTYETEGDVPYPGGLVTYTIALINTSDVTTDTLTVHNFTPISTAIESADGDADMGTAGVVWWLDVEVPPDSTTTQSFSVRIGNCVPPSTTITNTTHFSDGPDADSDQAVALMVYSPFRNSSVSVVGEPENAYEGSELTYELSLINNDDQDREVVVEMLVPQNTHLSGISISAVSAAATRDLSFSISVPPYAGEATKATVTLFIEDGFVSGGSARAPLSQVVKLYEAGCDEPYHTYQLSTNVLQTYKAYLPQFFKAAP